MRTNEEQLDLFADLLEPVGELLTDKDLVASLQGNDKMKAIQQGIKGHKAAIIKILALIDGVEVENYKVPSPPVLALKILNLLNEPEIATLFTPQGQNVTE